MPAVEEAPAARLTLAEFSGPDAPPDDAVHPSKNAAAEGAHSQQAPETQKNASRTNEEPAIAPIVDEEPEVPEADPDKPDKPDKNEPETTLADSMEDPVEVTKREREAAKEKEKKEADAATAAASQTEEDKNKAAEATAAEQRDSDLKYEPGAHTHPKTRTVITKFQAAAKAARDERDREKAERSAEVAQLKKERDELAEKSKTTALPKETEEEIKSLRERVRELDITQDPIIQKKYDSKITSNNETIINVLKSQGFGKVKKEGTEEFIDNPAAVSSLVKSGLTLKTLQPMIAALEKAELVEEADAIREAVRENNRITRDKQAEIDTWKGDYTKRQQERDSQTKQAQEARGQAFRATTDTMLKSDLRALAKDFSFINEPPAPLATDTPATRKAKEAAIAEWGAASKSIENRVKAFSTDGLSPEKLVDAVGRLNAAAIKAVVYDEQIAPRMKREMAALTARNKELEAELNKIRDAGKLSRQHTSASSNEPGYSGKPLPKSLDEAFENPGT